MSSGHGLLEVRGLVAGYRDSRGAPLPVLRGVDLQLDAGEAVALVGASGCGKSSLGRCLLGLHPVDAGSVRFAGRELRGLPERALRPLRRHLQLVFQDPRGALDPRQRVGAIVAEPLITFTLVPRRRRAARVAELLERVGLEEELVGRFPHELSGGQLQRVCIARALASGPRLLVADEPTSSLDLIAQARILELLAGLRDDGLALLLITHDLRLVPALCERVLVLDEGVIVERLGADELSQGSAPATRALWSAVSHPLSSSSSDS